MKTEQRRPKSLLILAGSMSMLMAATYWYQYEDVDFLNLNQMSQNQFPHNLYRQYYTSGVEQSLIDMSQEDWDYHR